MEQELGTTMTVRTELASADIALTAAGGRVPAVRRASTWGRAGLCLAVVLALGACGGKKAISGQVAPTQVTTIGVNSYLWRASLDALSFMPLLQTDSNGGVIVTDWYSNPRNPGERVKVSVTILDADLRADALRVATSREVNQGGNWVAAPVQAATVQKLEDIILTRARDLRRNSVG